MTAASAPARPASVRGLARGLLYGSSFQRAIELCEQTQWWSSGDLEALQWRQVEALLAEVYRRNPYYRRRLTAAGWPPGGRGWLSRVPALTKLEAVAHASEVAAGASRPAARTSGGSGGTPLPVLVDRATYPWYVVGFYRGLRWWGADFFDRAAVLLGRSRHSILWSAVARVKDWATGWLRVAVEGDFDARVGRVAAAVARYRPAFVYGYPSAVYRVARWLETASDCPPPRPRVVVTTGEPLFDFQRAAIERVFGCPVVEEYGCGELGSMGFQCPSGCLHVTAEAVLLEAPPAAAGPGPVVVTHLRNVRFPLIRYALGDLGTVDTEACPCGRGLPVFRFAGRSRECVRAPEGQVLALPRQRRFLSLLPEEAAGRVQVRVVAHDGDPGHSVPGAVDALVVAAERDALTVVSVDEVREAARQAFGDWCHVAVAVVERLRRSPSGKLPHFTRWRVPG
ncbi:MAG: hypothetical protein QN120_09375 [Armatimonadota bacterium]|nr:hypothetical protein [Armatimonadota bacterium]